MTSNLSSSELKECRGCWISIQLKPEPVKDNVWPNGTQYFNFHSYIAEHKVYGSYSSGLSNPNFFSWQVTPSYEEQLVDSFINCSLANPTSETGNDI